MIKGEAIKFAISNAWNAFLEHTTVNHSKDFVNTTDPQAHTQNIEAFWSVFKRKLKRNDNTGDCHGFSEKWSLEKSIFLHFWTTLWKNTWILLVFWQLRVVNLVVC